MNHKQLGTWIAVLAVLVFLIWKVRIEKKDPDTTSTPATTQQAPVQQGSHKQRLRFDDFPKGEIRVKVTRDAAFYPKGGCILARDPSGSTWQDCPGVQVVRPPAQPGTFIFVRVDSLAWGVDIWQ